MDIAEILVTGEQVPMGDLRTYLTPWDTLRARFTLDTVNNRMLMGDNVGADHITTGVRTQGGTPLTGYGFVAFGADIANGADNDATVSTGIGTGNLVVAGVKAYGSDWHGFRALESAEDIMYLGGFCIDAWKDVTFGRNSFGAGAKIGLYCESVEDTAGVGVSLFAGGGTLEALVGLGNSSFDNTGATDRVSLEDGIGVGNFICRNARGDLGGSAFGGHGIGQNSAVTPFAMAIWGSSAFGAMISPSLGAGLGWGCGSTITNEATVLSLGALSDPKFGGSTAVGPESVCTGANQLQLGDTGTTSYAFGAVQDRSDERDKVEITDLDLGLNFIRQVRFRKFRRNYREAYADVEVTIEMVDDVQVVEVPIVEGVDGRGQRKIRLHKVETPIKRPVRKVVRTFDAEAHARAERAGKRHHPGVIAQELKEVCDRLGEDFAGLQWHAFHNEDDSNEHQGEDVWSVAYQDFIPVLGRAVQELADRQDAIEKRLAKLEKKAT